MKFTYSTMRDYVATSLDAEALGDLLTMAGFELEGIEEETSEDPILDVKVMSNRGDGLSILGLAREVLAKDADSQPTDLYLAAKSGFRNVAAARPAEALVRIDSALCNRFACVTVSGISSAATPDWIKYRLERIGMRSISLLVDLTNYVMLDIGQPLHAYDLGKLGNTEMLPLQIEIEEFMQHHRINAIFRLHVDPIERREALHLYAKEQLDKSKVHKAWKALLVDRLNTHNTDTE
jgi:phenylalanyl-tRNA synthetase beta chain